MMKDLIEQLRHVDATPKVLNELEATAIGAVRHLYEVLDRAATELERVQAENKALKQLCRANGIKVPKAGK